MKITERFRSERSSVPAARRFATSALAELPKETLQAVELMVSELATNCVLHARTDFSDKERRLLRRVVVAGDRAY